MERDAAHEAATLAQLWQAALSRPMHSPACGCAVPSSVLLDPATMELDLLDYVEHKRGLDTLPSWRDALGRRSIKRDGTLADWLSSPENTGLDAHLHAVVVTDIANSLKSMASHAAGRLAPIGALNSGWLLKGIKDMEQDQ